MSTPFSAAIIGGSVGGLAAAIELRDQLGADVKVYERSAGEMQARGAGVVMQREVDALLNRIGVQTREVCVELHERVGLALDGRYSVNPAPQLMTAWDTLYKRLRAHLGDACYHSDSRLIGLDQSSSDVTARFADDHAAQSDLLVGADGVNSVTRQLLQGDEIMATYTGYVAWRGLEKESDLSNELVAALKDRFTSYMNPGMQMLCYLVPGADGETTPGHRRVNWVWYVNTPADDLDHFLTGQTGTRYRSFLPASDVTDTTKRVIHELANRSLPHLFRALVHESAIFMQPVQDVAAQPRVHGRSLLIGDAAGTVRPHTAAGTSKAFGDAALLTEALTDWTADDPMPEERLERWNMARTMDLEVTAIRGHRLAKGSGLGQADQLSFPKEL
ncbi:FAD-dependent monooxygenase [uncultured Tateyamaria sp.]|uniref:FAD binding domain-containing protein n=1 Tax=uncultured Tateyamaria sp. TaxID=455651 RepID=UPI002629C0D8|nr:FAD-dependent monooxygenase [uncultured Tateyamaria sp.]